MSKERSDNVKSTNVEEYVKRSVQTFLGDPPDTDFSMGLPQRAARRGKGGARAAHGHDSVRGGAGAARDISPDRQVAETRRTQRTVAASPSLSEEVMHA